MEITGTLSSWSFWLLMTILLGIFEIFTLSAVGLCLAVATAAGMVSALVGLPLQWQLFTVALTAVLALILLAPWFRRFLKRSAPSGREGASNMDALIGRQITLPANLDANDRIRVKIDGDSWLVKASDNTVNYSAGTRMTVCGFDSIILLVAPEDSRTSEKTI